MTLFYMKCWMQFEPKWQCSKSTFLVQGSHIQTHLQQQDKQYCYEWCQGAAGFNTAVAYPSTTGTSPIGLLMLEFRGKPCSCSMHSQISDLHEPDLVCTVLLYIISNNNTQLQEYPQIKGNTYHSQFMWTPLLLFFLSEVVKAEKTAQSLRIW